MSYRLDLDEYDEDVLIEELRHRKALRDEGKCDYCGRKPEDKSCKFPSRHIWNDPENKEIRHLLELLPYYHVELLTDMTQAIDNGKNFKSFQMVRREKPGKRQHVHAIRYCTYIQSLYMSPDKSIITVIVVTDPTR